LVFSIRYTRQEKLIDAIGQSGCTFLVPKLILLLKDEDSCVRRNAAYALSYIGDASVVEKLIPLLKDKHSYVRTSAAVALSYIGDASVVEKIIPLFKEETLTIVNNCVAARALGNIDDASVVEKLIPLLKDKNGGVRRYTATALGSICPRTFACWIVYAPTCAKSLPKRAGL
jgi:HEAT repeat protein